MTGFSNAFRTPEQLTGVARGAFDAAIAAHPTLRALFPVLENYTLDYSFNPGAVKLPAAAQYRSFSTESMVAEVPNATVSRGKLPPMSIRIPVDEQQQLKMYGQEDLIGAKFEDYAIRNAQAIAFRVIAAAGEALTASKVTIADRGLSFEINFGRPAKLDATAATKWGQAAATPIDDLEGLRKALNKPVAQTLIPRSIVAAMQKNSQVVEYATGSSVLTRVSVSDLADFLAGEGYGRLVITEDVVPDKTGADKAVFDPTKVVLAAGTAVGSIELGVTAEATARNMGADVAAGLFSGAIETVDPQGYDVLVSGILLPILSSPLATATIAAV